MDKIMPVIHELNSGCGEQGACVIERENFLRIYQIERFRQNRSWPLSHLLQIKIESSGSKDFNLKQADGLMLDILKSKIRGGDAICHWDKSHFVILLYDIGKNEVNTVYNRIEYFFYTKAENPDEINLIFSVTS